MTPGQPEALAQTTQKYLGKHPHERLRKQPQQAMQQLQQTAQKLQKTQRLQQTQLQQQQQQMQKTQQMLCELEAMLRNVCYSV